MSDVREWLVSLGLGQYGDAFKQGDVAWELLPQLDHEVLKDLGVNSPRHRLRILKAAASLTDREENPAFGITTPEFSRELPPSSEANRRQLTVMFCDLVGSTSLSEQMEVEDYREMLSDYQSAATNAIRRYEGYIARYMGDGLLIYFGYPTAHEDDAERAVRAALDTVDAVNKLPAPGNGALQVRIGIATGLVVAGDIVGEDASEEKAVLGETPNLAVRLQSNAEPNQV